MLIRTSNMRTCNLIALVVIAYITIGLPLIHPALHKSFAHDHQIAGHCVDHFQPILEKSKNHNCSICDFLATTQLNDTILFHFSNINEPFAKFVSIDQTTSVKTFLRQDEPRAPPAFIFPY